VGQSRIWGNRLGGPSSSKHHKTTATSSSRSRSNTTQQEALHSVELTAWMCLGAGGLREGGGCDLQRRIRRKRQKRRQVSDA
jgi:hypothetical protein